MLYNNILIKEYKPSELVEEHLRSISLVFNENPSKNIAIILVGCEHFFMITI